MVRSYARWTVLMSLGMASCTSMWRFYNRYVHYQHEENRRIQHAEFVLRSDACAKGGTGFVDCAGAQEAVETSMPNVNAMARAAEDWNLCGEGRCYDLAEKLLYALIPVSTLGCLLGLGVLLVFLNTAWWHQVGTAGRSKNAGVLDTGVRDDHHCLTVPIGFGDDDGAMGIAYDGEHRGVRYRRGHVARMW